MYYSKKLSSPVTIIAVLILTLALCFTYSCKKGGSGSLEDTAIAAMNGFADAIENNEGKCDEMAEAMAPHAKSLGSIMPDLQKKYPKEPTGDMKKASLRFQGSVKKLGACMGNPKVIAAFQSAMKK